MSDTALHQPHDKLFRATFSQPKNACAFLRCHLPHDIEALLSWDTLVAKSPRYTDTNYAAFESDLAYTARFHGSTRELIILLEHQRAQHPALLLRFLGYVTRTWERLIRSNPSSHLPPVLCMVVAQSGSPWAGPENLAHLVEICPEAELALRQYQPSLGIHALDLFQTPYHRLKGTPDGTLTLRALKAQPVGELLSDAVWDQSLICKVSAHTEEMFLRYVLNAEDNRAAVLARAEKVRSKSFLTNAMTIAQQLIEEGRVEGRVEGREEGRQEGGILGRQQSILLCLEIRFGELPDTIRSQITAVKSIAKLESILSTAIHNSSLEQIALSLR